MNLRNRLEKLEQVTRGREDTILRMPGGGIVRLTGDPIAIYQKVFRDPNCDEALALRKCLDVIEPDGHLLELARAVLIPVFEEFEQTEVKGPIQ